MFYLKNFALGFRWYGIGRVTGMSGKHIAPKQKYQLWSDIIYDIILI